jgi:hypothetical protein
MAKKTGKRKAPAARRSAGRRTATPRRKPAASRRARKTRKPAAKKAAAKVRKPAAKKTGRAAKVPARARKTPPQSPKAKSPKAQNPKAQIRRKGGTGLERTLAQTPETGRSVKGRTNPMATRRSTGTPAGAGDLRLAPGLDRARKQLRDVEEHVPTPPSSLDLDRTPSAARSGRRGMREARLDHNEVSPEITAGDVDADWQEAYSVGDEAPGGDNPTPDQDRVDDIGRALGIEYEDSEELKAADKITERDRHRWELDPASAEDYKDRD